MVRLTEEQKDFLRRYNIDHFDVFDASGLGAAEWKAEMRARNAKVAVCVTKCKRKGHSMRSSGGHCVMCTPSNLSFHARWRSKGEIYMAYSASMKLVKIGSSTSIAGAEGRVITLNKQRYAEVHDWILLQCVEVSDVGKLENVVHQKLSSYRKLLTYTRRGKAEVATEVFNCTPEKAKREIAKAKKESSDL